MLFHGLFLGSLIWAALSDLKRREIPNLCCLGLLLAGCCRIQDGRLALEEAVVSLLAIGLLMLACSLWRDSMGGGDVKLAACASFAVGLVPSIHAMTASIGAAVIVGLLMMLIRGKKGGIPLAPFFLTGYAIIFYCEV